MARYVLFAAILLLCFKPCFAQTDTNDINIKDIHYEPVKEDYFADYKDAKLIVNYYCSDGWSVINRYSYEVVVIDSMLMLGFDAPETESMNYISYEKKQMLTRAQAKLLKEKLKSAKLTQKKAGIPRPDVSSNTKEVLIVKYDTLNIVGGMFNYNMLQEDQPKIKIETERARQRKITSSVGGDYDAVIQVMKGFFPDLTKLMTQTLKIK